jgi:GT2 family glycosyltransferase
MALLSMAVFDTEENNRTELTKKTVTHLLPQLREEDELLIVDNGSCYATRKFLSSFSKDENVHVVHLEKNIGTAKAVNIGWMQRKPGQYCVKIDNDVIIDNDNWIAEMEEAMQHDKALGILGLKRKDLMETPYFPDINYRSSLKMLPHEPGERWIIIEVAKHIMGTVTMFSPELLDKIGYLYQPTVYGFDDGIACVRARAAGFYNAFLPHIEIDHIDKGGDGYTDWKRKHAGEHIDEASKYMTDILLGKVGYYYDGN